MDPLPTDRDQRPPRFAWAPGSYLAECSHCGKRFIGDKRARLCAPCAYNDEGHAKLREENKRLREQLDPAGRW